MALVETALILPILIWLAVGSFDFGHALIGYVELEEAAHEGAIYGSFQPGGNVEGRTRTSSSGLIDLSDTTAVSVAVEYCDIDTSTCSATWDCASDTVEVTVGYDLDLVMPVIAQMFGGTISLESSSIGTIFATGTC